jgi:hypothetical protein
MSLGKKSLSRRHLLTITGGAVGAAASSNALASVISRPVRPAKTQRPGSGVSDNSAEREGLFQRGGNGVSVGSDFGGPRTADGAGETRTGSDFGGDRTFEGSGPFTVGTDFGGPRFSPSSAEAVHDEPRAYVRGTETGGPNYRGLQARGGVDLLGRELALPPPTGSDFNGVPLNSYAPPMPAPKGPVLREYELPVASPAVLGLFGGARVGTVVGGCKVVAIHDVHMGAVPVVLETRSGHRFQVDVLRRDAAVRGAEAVAVNGSFALYLANRAAGGARTREEVGVGVRGLAQAIAGQAPRALLTLRQRNTRFPRGGFAVPV